MNKKEIYSLLESSKILYELYEHDAAYTIEDLDSLDIPNKELIVKNLFLRDDKKRNYYLVTLPGDKKINLKSLSEEISSRKLSFADEESLYEFLQLKKGHVTPLGILNNVQKNVAFVYDSCLQRQMVGVHPMENTATVFMEFQDILKLVKDHGNPIIVCNVESI